MCMSCCRTEMGIEEKDSRQWAPDLRLYDCSGPQMIEIDLSHSHRPGLMSKGWVLGMFSHHSFCSLCRFQPQKLPRFSFSVTHLSTDAGTSGWCSTQPISAAGSVPAPPPSLFTSLPSGIGSAPGFLRILAHSCSWGGISKQKLQIQLTIGTRQVAQLSISGQV